MLQVVARLERIIEILKVTSMVSPLVSEMDLCIFFSLKGKLYSIQGEVIHSVYLCAIFSLVQWQILAQQMVVIETMSPLDFLKFRYNCNE